MSVFVLSDVVFYTLFLFVLADNNLKHLRFQQLAFPGDQTQNQIYIYYSSLQLLWIVIGVVFSFLTVLHLLGNKSGVLSSRMKQRRGVLTICIMNAVNIPAAALWSVYWGLSGELFISFNFNSFCLLRL